MDIESPCSRQVLGPEAEAAPQRAALPMREHRAGPVGVTDDVPGAVRVQAPVTGRDLAGDRGADRPGLTGAVR